MFESNVLLDSKAIACHFLNQKCMAPKQPKEILLSLLLFSEQKFLIKPAGDKSAITFADGFEKMI